MKAKALDQKQLLQEKQCDINSILTKIQKLRIFAHYQLFLILTGNEIERKIERTIERTILTLHPIDQETSTLVLLISEPWLKETVHVPDETINILKATK